MPGPLPGMNEIIAAAKSGRGKSNAYARLKKYWHTIIILSIRQAKIKPVESAVIEFVWAEKNKRRDPDNIVVGRKFILDGLVEARILKNDGWGQVLKFTDEWCVSQKPGIKVTLS